MSKNKLDPSSDYFLRTDKNKLADKDIKVGETYYIRVKVTEKSKNCFVCRPLLCGGIMSDFAPNFFNFAEAEAFNKLYPSNPKYAPCRIFRKGDIVEIDTHGRDIAASMKKAGVELGKRYTVTEDESDIGRVSFIGDDGIEHNSMFFWLKLITPVEEQERYVVIHNKNEKHFDVCWKDDDEPDGRTGRTRSRVTYWYHQPPMTHTEEEAKAAAEAECARLKVEYRKEQKHDK